MESAISRNRRRLELSCLDSLGRGLLLPGFPFRFALPFAPKHSCTSVDRDCVPACYRLWPHTLGRPAEQRIPGLCGQSHTASRLAITGIPAWGCPGVVFLANGFAPRTNISPGNRGACGRRDFFVIEF